MLSCGNCGWNGVNLVPLLGGKAGCPNCKTEFQGIPASDAVALKNKNGLPDVHAEEMLVVKSAVDSAIIEALAQKSL